MTPLYDGSSARSLSACLVSWWSTVWRQADRREERSNRNDKKESVLIAAKLR